jgi:hypothetical protein
MDRGATEPEVEREAARMRVGRLLAMARVTNLEDLAAAARQRAAELIAEYSFKVVIGKDGGGIVIDAPSQDARAIADQDAINSTH